MARSYRSLRHAKRAARRNADDYQVPMVVLEHEGALLVASLGAAPPKSWTRVYLAKPRGTLWVFFRELLAALIILGLIAWAVLV